MTLDAKLLDILVCPEDHGPLVYVAGECLYNARLRRAYPIVGGIPVLLVDEALAVTDDAEHERLIGAAQADRR
jgi:uncharacterized protein YbaR (Trm112 family)